MRDLLRPVWTLQALGLDNLTTIVVATGITKHVRALQLATIGAFVEGFHLQRIM